MAITTMDGLITGLTGGATPPYYRTSLTSKAAGSFHSLWVGTGIPLTGAAQGSANGAICTKDTGGAIFYNNAGVGNTKYLAGVRLASTVIGTLILYDRLWHNSTFSGTVLTAQACSQPTLTRATSGIGVEAFLEFYAATGSTGVTASMSYYNTTSPTPTLGTATAKVPATTVIGQLVPFTLGAGDNGITSVVSVTLSGTTGTAGNFGVTLMRRLVEIPIPIANTGVVLDAIALGMPALEDNTCLAAAVFCSGTSTGIYSGSLKFAEG